MDFNQYNYTLKAAVALAKTLEKDTVYLVMNIDSSNVFLSYTCAIYNQLPYVHVRFNADDSIEFVDAQFKAEYEFAQLQLEVMDSIHCYV